MDEFFKAEGLQKIMFFFQESDSNIPEAGTLTHELCLFFYQFLIYNALTL